MIQEVANLSHKVLPTYLWISLNIRLICQTWPNCPILFFQVEVQFFTYSIVVFTYSKRKSQTFTPIEIIQIDEKQTTFNRSQTDFLFYFLAFRFYFAVMASYLGVIIVADDWGISEKTKAHWRKKSEVERN